MKKFLLSIFAVLFAFAGAQAQEVVYTLVPAKGSNNSYASNCDITIDGITWNLEGNSQQLPWRIGGKSLANVDRALYSKTPMEWDIDKVVLKTGTASSITVNSAKLLVAANADFSGAVEYPFSFKASSSIEIPVSAAFGSYFKFVFNVSVSSTSNKFIQISGVDFYGAVVGNKAKAPTLPESCSFEETKTIAITNNTDDATVYYSTDGEKYQEYTNELVLTATTTVTAYAQIGEDETTRSSEVSETYTKIEPQTIAEVLEAGEVSSACTKGTVVATYAKGFLLSDETGRILVYLNSTPSVTAGDVVIVNGKTSTYGGLLQFAAGTEVVKSGTATVEHPAVTVMDGAALDAFLNAPEVKYVEYTGTLNINGSYYNITVDGAANAVAAIQYPNDGLITVATGNLVKVTGYTIGISSNKYVNTMAIKVELATESQIPSAPVLKESANFGEEFEVTITAEDGTTIYYTTNGDTPTTECEVYSQPFTITETTTVKAIAVKDEMESSVAEATYTKINLIDLNGCSVADAIEAYGNGQTGNATIIGYIVGVMVDNAVAFGNVTAASNLVIADDVNETNSAKCIPVQLSNGTAIRNALNLLDNPANLGKKVKLTGSLEKYFTVAGLKSLNEAGLYWNVSNVDYATLYLGYKAVVPETVEAYIVTEVNADCVILSQVSGIIPEEVGLILKGEGEHLFNITTDPATAEVADNKLLGTAADERIGVEAYVLSAPNGVVGLYKAEMNKNEAGEAGTTHFLNNANKAYLPAGAVPNKSAAFYGFDWDGTTGIEKVEIRNEKSEIYDLTGRRVEAITAPGIYIVGGKKVLVK